MNKTVTLRDINGDVCFPKTVKDNVVGLSAELDEITKDVGYKDLQIEWTEDTSVSEGVKATSSVELSKYSYLDIYIPAHTRLKISYGSFAHYYGSIESETEGEYKLKIHSSYTYALELLGSDDIGYSEMVEGTTLQTRNKYLIEEIDEDVVARTNETVVAASSSFIRTYDVSDYKFMYIGDIYNENQTGYGFFYYRYDSIAQDHSCNSGAFVDISDVNNITFFFDKIMGNPSYVMNFSFFRDKESLANIGEVTTLIDKSKYNIGSYLSFISSTNTLYVDEKITELTAALRASQIGSAFATHQAFWQNFIPTISGSSTDRIPASQWWSDPDYLPTRITNTLYNSPSTSPFMKRFGSELFNKLISEDTGLLYQGAEAAGIDPRWASYYIYNPMMQHFNSIGYSYHLGLLSSLFSINASHYASFYARTYLGNIIHPSCGKTGTYTNGSLSMFSSYDNYSAMYGQASGLIVSFSGLSVVSAGSAWFDLYDSVGFNLMRLKCSNFSSAEKVDIRYDFNFLNRTITGTMTCASKSSYSIRPLALSNLYYIRDWYFSNITNFMVTRGGLIIY